MKTDNAKLDPSGLASFNEKIEMKTTIKEGEAKNSTISACIMSGGQLISIGQCNLNLSDFKNPNKYIKTFYLSNDTKNDGSIVMVNLEINTANVDSKKGRSSVLH